MPRSTRPCASTSRTTSSAAAPWTNVLRLSNRVTEHFALARPRVLELPAVLRFQAQAQRLLELGRRRARALGGELHEEARRDNEAIADLVDEALGDAPPVQPDAALAEIR